MRRLKRIHVPVVRAGALVRLEAAQVHHARDVLRLGDGDAVEAFDDAGRRGRAVLRERDGSLHAEIGEISDAADVAGGRGAASPVVVASAVPKGDRADWMVEKLSELGVDRFVPLETQRGVVVPAGRNKLDRWRRIAQESAKQSRRRGVMAIDGVTPVDQALAAHGDAPVIALSTEREDARPLAAIDLPAGTPALLVIGPEGGWTEDELALLSSRGAAACRLTDTILRTETAAVVAAAVLLCRRGSN